jgi:tetratricopeptide (TPR) repeat protein
VKLDPNNPGLHEKLGDAYSGVGNYSKAVDEYKGVMGQGRSDAVILYKSGNAYLNHGVYNQAAFFCTEATKRSNRFGDAYLCLGRAHARMGNTDDALKALNKAREQLPNDPNVLYELGLIYIKKKNGREAGNYINRLYRLNDMERARKLADLAAREGLQWQ